MPAKTRPPSVPAGSARRSRGASVRFFGAPAAEGEPAVRAWPERSTAFGGLDLTCTETLWPNGRRELHRVGRCEGAPVNEVLIDDARV